ncbi:AmmeMemoRadiSam system protein A [Candidatus Pacearchaeota archaeon]|nr:AmmeMemoRadiSam system protein A [Candidatus Pacearchaeota archaeon]
MFMLVMSGNMALKLTEIARKTLEEYFKGGNFLPDDYTRSIYNKKQACFVTLTIDGKLRGCIGSLIPQRELWKDVQENAINAAVHDFRFPKLTEKELSKIKIEISVLSLPKKIKSINEKDLLMRVNPGKGYILKKGGFSSTFLPQVWEQIPDKIEFLESLSVKAGLNRNSWKSGELWSYSVIVEKED